MGGLNQPKSGHSTTNFDNLQSPFCPRNLIRGGPLSSNFIAADSQRNFASPGHPTKIPAVGSPGTTSMGRVCCKPRGLVGLTFPGDISVGVTSPRIVSVRGVWGSSPNNKLSIAVVAAGTETIAVWGAGVSKIWGSSRSPTFCCFPSPSPPLSIIFPLVLPCRSTLPCVVPI